MNTLLFSTMLDLIVLAVQVGEVNISAFPVQLQAKLMLPSLWVAELLASLIFILIPVIVVVVFAKEPILPIVVGYVMIFFCTALEWLDGWIVMVLVLIASGLWSFGQLYKLAGG